MESGAVGVVGLPDLAAEPVAVEAGNAATLEAAGTVAAPAAWTGDDWGAWRVEHDEVDAAAVVAEHGAALAALDAQVVTACADLETTATFKTRKHTLRDEGVDPSRVKDPLYVLLDRARGYEPLTTAIWTRIQQGSLRL